jgi:hypothetical protein
MSISFIAENFEKDDLVDFLEDEYAKGTGIPVHLYSVVNATMSEFNRSLAITDGKIGTLFITQDVHFTAYGNGDPFPLVNTLRRCNALLRCTDN